MDSPPINAINATGMAQRLHRRRVIAGVVAVVLSLLLHGFFAESIRRGWVSVSGVGGAEHAAAAADPLPPMEVEIRPQEWIRTVEAMDRLRLVTRETEAESVELDKPELSRVDPAIFEPERAPSDLLDDSMQAEAEVLETSPLVNVGPGQEILQITERLAADSADALRRISVPVERTRAAPDIVVPAARDEFLVRATAAPLTDDMPDPDLMDFGMEAWTPLIDRFGDDPDAGMIAGTDHDPFDRVPDVAEEPARDIVAFEPIDRFLKVRVQQYTTPRDRQFGYVAIEVVRHDDDFLPVMPKDVVFIVDLSGSMGERRVAACREGIRKALAILSPLDRFNIATFAHDFGIYDDAWVPVTPANIKTVQPFLDGLVSEGLTDIDAALNRIVDIERDPDRPALALLLTDGIPTAGVTNSTRIIENYTVRNRGAISTFAVAAAPDPVANMYLLDMLAYRNRGDARAMQAVRWEIPILIETLFRENARPVLTDLRYRFTRDSQCDAYPIMLSHLYLDRPLVIHGRFPRDKQELVFQVVGRSGGRQYDFFFRLQLDRVPRGDADIRIQWARHRMYYLIGEHMRTGDQRVLRELFDTARQYGLEIPYLEDFSPPSRLLPWR